MVRAAVGNGRCAVPVAAY